MENKIREKEIHNELKTLLDGVTISINYQQKIEMFRLYNELYQDKQNNLNCSSCVKLVYNRCKSFIDNYKEDEIFTPSTTIEFVNKPRKKTKY